MFKFFNCLYQTQLVFLVFVFLSSCSSVRVSLFLSSCFSAASSVRVQFSSCSAQIMFKCAFIGFFDSCANVLAKLLYQTKQIMIAN